MYSLLAIAVIGSACKKSDDPDNSGNNQAADQNIVRLSTDFGEMHIYLYNETPLHRDNFLKLANEGFYNGTTFHRCIDNFVIQGGDPNSKDNDPSNDGNGGPGYTIPAEIVSGLLNVRGSLATARLGNTSNPEKESSGSQFYINLKHNTNLDGEYTVFGMVVDGMDVADEIVAQPKNGTSGRPNTDIKMQVEIVKMSKADVKSKFGYTIP